jgi:ABC-type lipoprotein export system ATPase subunit
VTQEDWQEALAVELQQVCVQLGQSGRRRVDFGPLDLTVAPSERVALTGPSGCGKSTALNLIAGLLTCDAGAVQLGEVNVDELTQPERDAFRGRNVGYIFQRFHLLDEFSALENVLIGMRFGRSVSGRHRKHHARQLLAKVGLVDRMHSRPGQLSVGECQRVAIARAIANKPRLLLADEPTGSLDPTTAGEINTLINDLCDELGCTYLMVTHDLDLAAQLPRQLDCSGFIAGATSAPAASNKAEAGAAS